MLKIDVVRSVAALRAATQPHRREGKRIGLVPTMGALHQGHLELVKSARRHAGFVVATIFVNPLQFNPAEDLDAYPRDEATDLNLLAATGADLVFAPNVAEMYPKNFSTEVKVDGLTKYLDGPARPGHFEGVATVVTKLFNRVEPDLACFGEKDFQQLQVIRRMIRDLDLPIEIEPLVREHAAYHCDIGTPASTLAGLWPALSFAHLDETWWSALDETEAQLLDRCKQFHQLGAGWTDWSEVAVVSHWAFIRGLTGRELRNAELLAFDPSKQFA